MSHSISKNDPNRWFLVQSIVSGESGIMVFGNVGEQGVNQLVTGQPNLANYLTEDELETEVNNVAGIPNYYKDAVESGSSKFQLPSGKYSPPEE